jgi:hypothetical protein
MCNAFRHSLQFRAPVHFEFIACKLFGQRSFSSIALKSTCKTKSSLVCIKQGASMFFPKITTLAFIGLLAISSRGLGQSLAQPGKMCLPEAEMVVPSLTCLNPDGGNDVRLYIMEFQSCNKGEIKKIEKTVSGFAFSEPQDTYQANKVDVVYGSRIVMDDRVDNLTFELPSSALITTKYGKYELTITNTLVPTYEGAEQYGDMSFGGSFKQLSLSGELVAEGRLLCNVSR